MRTVAAADAPEASTAAPGSVIYVGAGARRLVSGVIPPGPVPAVALVAWNTQPTPDDFTDAVTATATADGLEVARLATDTDPRGLVRLWARTGTGDAVSVHPLGVWTLA